MVKKSRSKRSSKEKKSKKEKLEERSSPRTEEEDAYRQIDKSKKGKKGKKKKKEEESLEEFIEVWLSELSGKKKGKKGKKKKKEEGKTKFERDIDRLERAEKIGPKAEAEELRRQGFSPEEISRYLTGSGWLKPKKSKEPGRKEGTGVSGIKKKVKNLFSFGKGKKTEQGISVEKIKEKSINLIDAAEEAERISEQKGIDAGEAFEKVVGEVDRPVKEKVEKLVKEGDYLSLLPESTQEFMGRVWEKMREEDEVRADSIESVKGKAKKKKAKKVYAGSVNVDSDSLFDNVNLIKLVIIFIVLAFIIGLAAAL